MQANQLISSTIESIHPDEDGNKALELMDQFRVNHLAIVKNNFFLAIISDKEIMNWNSKNEYLEEHLTHLASPYVKHNQHLFDIIEVLEKNNLSVVPVLDEENQYKDINDFMKINFIQDLQGLRCRHVSLNIRTLI